ncbi:MAG: uroporphyrinogen-III C-methyltransferase [Lachnoclostridium sp.]|jgi:uroporphyrinogen III methyltransferase / synthase
MNKIGMVSLVGAGPGDEELITLKGADRLKKCEVVIYDRLASEKLLDLTPFFCEKIYVGKDVGGVCLSQDEINQIIIRKALEGKRVVRLKGGDPFVFGRGGEEVLALQKAGIPYEVIPGISSAIAAGVCAGIPVTHRGISQSFHVITGHTKDYKNKLTKNYETLAKLDGTLIFLMGMGNLSEIVYELIRHGKDGNTPAAIVSNGSTNKQRVVKGRLKDIPDKAFSQNITAPAVVIIGDVVKLNLKATYGKLYGKKIGVTGTRKLTARLIGKLKELGACVFDLSLLTVKEPEDKTEIQKTILRLQSYTWLVFTSANGVELFFQYLKVYKTDYRKLSHLSFAVVGPGTKEALWKQGFLPDYMPDEFTTVSLAKGLVKILKENDRVLIIRAFDGSKELTGILKEHYVSFTDLKMYSLEINEEKYIRVKNDLPDYDYVTFASPSGVDSIFKNLDAGIYDKIKNTKMVCIGKVTAERLMQYGIKNFLIAKESTTDGILEAILKNEALEE